MLARFELLQLLRRQSERGALTVIYATHIFDGLEDWATHLIYLRSGHLDACSALDDIDELHHLRQDRASHCTGWWCSGWRVTALGGSCATALERLSSAVL